MIRASKAFKTLVMIMPFELVNQRPIADSVGLASVAPNPRKRGAKPR